LGISRRAVPRLAVFRRPGALTASAQRADRSKGELLRLDQAWQRKAMHVYRTVGECWNPAQYQARAMERIRYFPAVLNDKGVPEETTDSKIVDLFNMITSPSGAPGDLSIIAGQYARLQFVIGDGLLTVSQDDSEEVWEYLSPMELRMDPEVPGRRQQYKRHRAPGVPPEALEEAPDSEFEEMKGDDVRVWRLWRPDPEYSQRAESPVKPVLDLYHLLDRLTLAADAEASSRAAQRGLLFIPDELTFGPIDASQSENPDEDPVIAELRQAMERAIQNPGSAEAMAPFVMRAAGTTVTQGGTIPTADLIKWIPLGPNDRYAEGEMWDKVISRIAGNIDMPKELLTGVGDVSHWGQWFLDDIGFRQHTGPTVIRFCNDFASAYLRPAAIRAGVDNAPRVTIWFDPSQAVNHPDETGVALKAHDAGVVGDAYVRGKIGATEDDAPTPEERARYMTIKLKKDPSSDQPHHAPGETPPQSGGRGGDANQNPPSGDSPTRPSGAKPPSPEGPGTAAMIHGAALMQLVRARELAGNRLKNRAQSCEECRETIKGLKPQEYMVALGPEKVREVINGYASEADLVVGVGSGFAQLLESWGVNGGWPEQLGAMLESHAQRTLYEREVPPLPSGFLSACQRAVSDE
jgi:hypothetical protein